MRHCSRCATFLHNTSLGDYYEHVSIHSPPFLAKGYTAIVGRRFAQAFEDYKPHLIVSVHPLMQHVPLKVLSRMKTDISFPATKIPFTTVVTDLTRCHRTWFHKVYKVSPITTCFAQRSMLIKGRGQVFCCYRTRCSTSDEGWPCRQPARMLRVAD